MFQVTELLIKHGANVNAKDLWAFTPIHEAVSFRRFSPHIKSHGQTNNNIIFVVFIDIQASKSRIEVCSLLLSEKADPTLLNCHNKTAIDSAPTPELRHRIECKKFFFSEMFPHKILMVTLIIIMEFLLF